MRKKHDYASNSKIVAGAPHSYGEPHQASAEPAGGGAQGPQVPMFAPPKKAYADGGLGSFMSGAAGGAGSAAKTMLADGGEPLGNGIRGHLSDYGNALKQTASDMLGLSGKNPVASGNKDEPYEGVGGAARKAAMDAQIDEESK